MFDGLALPGVKGKPPGNLTLNRSHPLARGLAAYIVFGGRYNLGYDVVTGALFAPGAGSPFATMTRDGTALDNTTGAALVQATSRPSWNVLSDITVVWRGIVRTPATHMALFNKMTGGGGDATPFSLEISNNKSARLSLTHSNASYRVWSSGSQVVQANTLTTLGATADRLVEVAPKFYMDGVEDLTASVNEFGGSTTGPATGNSSPLIIGRRGDGFNSLNGITSVAVLAARKWTAAEHRQFHRDPFAVVTDAAAPLFFVGRPAAGGTPATANPGPATLTLAGTTPTPTAAASVTAGAAAIALAGRTATATAAATASPGAAAVALAGRTATATAAAVVTAGAAALALAGRTATATGAALASPGAAALALAGTTPTPTAAATVTPGAAALLLAGLGVSAGATTAATATPGPATLVLSGAVVSATAGAEVSPGAASLTLAGLLASVSAAALVTPGAAALALSGRGVNQAVAVVPASRRIALPARDRLTSLATRDRLVALPSRNRITTLAPERD